ncbi:MAG: DUF1549 domain-containing protein [Fimbriiglobus sp.]
MSRQPVSQTIFPLLGIVFLSFFSSQTASAQLRGLEDDDGKVVASAERIDRILAKSWSEQKATPAPRADDAEYLRRAYLDLLGRTPRVAEIREFLDDNAGDKRRKLVAKLVDMPSHNLHVAAVWRENWTPVNNSDFRMVFAGDRFENWLREQYKLRVPMDVLARDLLTANVVIGQRGRIADRNNRGEPEQKSFYEVSESKPESIAANASRIFLGIKIECAQCHDHPFAPYKREQFWQFAAFFGEFTAFSPISPSFVGPLLPHQDINQIDIPNTSTTVSAKFFDGTSPIWNERRTPREELVKWMTSPDNPYFARNIGNRLWAQFFGIGLIDPIDEPGPDNAPSHPELLDELTKIVRESKYDMRLLQRIITATQAYNLTSRQTHASQTDPRRFARMNVRGLTGHQIFDSFLAATGAREDAPRTQSFYNRNTSMGRFGFVTLFGKVVQKPTESQTSILQSLMMMNGGDIANQTLVGTGETLTAVYEAPFLKPKAKIETLYLAALGRNPTDEETRVTMSRLDAAKKPNAQKQVYSDLFWVLLNSPEFLFNR